jgi:hypothetical protein
MMAHRSNTHLKSRYVPISAFLANNADFYQNINYFGFFLLIMTKSKRSFVRDQSCDFEGSTRAEVKTGYTTRHRLAIKGKDIGHL